MVYSVRARANKRNFSPSSLSSSTIQRARTSSLSETFVSPFHSMAVASSTTGEAASLGEHTRTTLGQERRTPQEAWHLTQVAVNSVGPPKELDDFRSRIPETPNLTGLTLPSAEGVIQKKPEKVDKSAKTEKGELYCDSRNTELRMQRIEPDGPEGRRFRIDGWEYQHHEGKDQYVDNGWHYDPERKQALFHVSHADLCTEVEFFADVESDCLYFFDQKDKKYVEPDITRDFKPGDLLYGKESERKIYRAAQTAIAKNRPVTADMIHEDLGWRTYQSSPQPPKIQDAEEYLEYLKARDIEMDEMDDEARIRRSCRELIKFKTVTQEQQIHFELRGVNLEAKDGDTNYGYTEHELAYFRECPELLKSGKVLFYKDGMRTGPPSDLPEPASQVGKKDTERIRKKPRLSENR